MDPNISVVQNLLIQGALVDKNGTPYNAELLKECKIFVLYFSAHWCPPCRQFTPILAEQFRIYRQTSSKAMVIFVSGDRSFQEQLNYMGKLRIFYELSQYEVRHHVMSYNFQTNNTYNNLRNYWGNSHPTLQRLHRRNGWLYNEKVWPVHHHKLRTTWTMSQLDLLIQICICYPCFI